MTSISTQHHIQHFTNATYHCTNFSTFFSNFLYSEKRKKYLLRWKILQTILNDGNIFIFPAGSNLWNTDLIFLTNICSADSILDAVLGLAALSLCSHKLLFFRLLPIDIFNTILNVPIKNSARSFDPGRYGSILCIQIHVICNNFVSKVNWVPLSDSILYGTPNLKKTKNGLVVELELNLQNLLSSSSQY